MNCAAYLRNLYDYFEGRLPDTERRAIEAHAASCAGCGEIHAKALETTCREVADLYDYVAGTLPPEKLRIYERHFSICDPCRNYLATYRETMRRAKDARAPSEPLDDSLLRSVLDARRRQG